MSRHLSPNELKEALSTSSSVNRALGITFVLFLFYVSVSIFSTTDTLLFLPESEINLPIIDIILPLKVYYILAPFLVLVFHFNLLINLQKHAEKYIAWHQNYKQVADSNLLLHPFLFNYSSGYFQYKGQIVLILIIRSTLFSLPLALLTFILLRFAKYQSFSITSIHFLIVAIDLILIFYFSDNIEKVLSFNLSQSKLTTIVTTFDRILRVFIFTIAVACFMILALLVSDNMSSQVFEQFKVIIPHLDLRGKKLISYEPNDKVIDYYINHSNSDNFEQEVNQLKIKFSRGYNLVGRNFYFIDLSNTTLTNVNLDMSELRGANLESAQLQGASLIGANLKESNLKGANLQKANLKKAELQSTHNYLTNFSQAYLHETNLTGAYLRRAVFQEANLEDAQLNGSIVIDSDFTSSNLRGVDFIGAHLSNVTFKGSYIIYADFSASYLENILFHALDLEGVNFNYCELHGNFSVAWSYLKETEFSGAKPERNIFQMTNLYNSNATKQAFSIYRNSINQPFNREQRQFLNDIQEVSDQIFVPAGESNYRYETKYRGRMKKAWEVTKTDVLNTPPLLVDNVNALNQMRFNLPIRDAFLNQGMICKFLFGNESLENLPECKAVYNRLKSNNPEQLKDVENRIRKMQSIKEQYDLKAQVYPSLLDSEH